MLTGNTQQVKIILVFAWIWASIVSASKVVIFERISEIAIVYTDDETPVNRIMGLFEPDPFKENVYIQTKPMYKENPFVIFLTNELSFVFVKSSIYNDKQFNMASYNFQFQIDAEKLSDGSIMFGKSVFAKVKGDFTLSQLEVLVIEDLKFTEFSGSTFTYFSVAKDFWESRRICHALDGTLTAPYSTAVSDFLQTLIPPNVEAVWTGVRRSSTSNQWKWKFVNGESFYFYYPPQFNATGFGCVTSLLSQELEAVTCSRSYTFMCQIEQFYFTGNTWTRFFDKKSSLAFSKTVCPMYHPNSFLLSHSVNRKFSETYLKNFEIEHSYWLDIQFNHNLDKFVNGEGEEIEELLWDSNQPDFKGDCVVMQKNGLLRSISCDDEAGIACQYNISPNVLGSFQYKDSWVWISSERNTRQEAVDFCHRNNQDSLIVDDVNILPEIIKMLYSSSNEAHTMWVEVGKNISLLYDVNLKESNSVANCLILKVRPYLQFSSADCKSKALFACRSRNTFEFTQESPKYCPDEFDNLGGTTCLATVQKGSSWGVGYETCKRVESDLVGLDETSTSSWVVPLLSLYMKTKNLKEVWTGMCKQATENVPGFTKEGFCASLYLNQESSQLEVKSWEQHFPFVCQMDPSDYRPKSNESLSQAMETSYTTLTPCFTSYNIEEIPEKKCFYFSSDLNTWSDSCSSFGLLAYNSPEANEKLQTLLKIFKWFSADEAWIGLEVINQTLIWNSEQNSGFTAWEHEDYLFQHTGKSCVAINDEGFWKLRNCSHTLPAVCDTEFKNNTNVFPDTIGRNVETFTEKNNLSNFDALYNTSSSEIVPSNFTFPAYTEDAVSTFPSEELKTNISTTTHNSPTTSESHLDRLEDEPILEPERPLVFPENEPPLMLDEEIIQSISEYVLTTTSSTTEDTTTTSTTEDTTTTATTEDTTTTATTEDTTTTAITKDTTTVSTTEDTTITSTTEDTTIASTTFQRKEETTSRTEYCSIDGECVNSQCPEQGSWSTWAPQYLCSKTCGSGLTILYRVCECPSGEHLIAQCEGNSTMVGSCSEGLCPVDGAWSEWSDWSSPGTLACGVRNVTRTRLCDSPAPVNGGLLCEGLTSDRNTTETLLQQTETKVEVAVQPCPGDYSWGAWSLFSSCSATCGEDAWRTRTRICEWNDKEFSGIKECVEQESQSLHCGDVNCPIDGQWSNWTIWSPCSVSCGQGVQYRYRLCDSPLAAYGGKQCTNSTTGSQHEEQLCENRDCPIDRYQADEYNFPHCPEERSRKTSILWKVTYSNTMQTQPCPAGSVGKATRKCSQQQTWLEEDMSDCVVSTISEFDSVSKLSAASEDLFDEAMEGLTKVLSQDLTGETLRSSGDLTTVPKIIKSLLKWKPFRFNRRTQSARLNYVGLITKSVEQALKPKYKRLWNEINITTQLRTFQAYMSMLDDASLEGSGNLNFLSYSKYESSASDSLNLMLASTSGWKKSMRYPDEQSPQLVYDESFVELPDDALTLANDSVVRLTFSKLDDSNDLLSSLSLSSLPQKEQLSFNGRKLNSAILGVQVKVDGKPSKEHRLDGYVYIKLYHKRESNNQICVFVDLDSADGIFNSDGCEIWRQRDDWTLCRCNHLTNFALLSHDTNNEERWWRVTLFNFRSLISGVNFFCIAVLVLIFILIFYPQSVDLKRDSTSVWIVLAATLRYGAVQVILWFCTSQLICLAAASLLSYTTTLCITSHAMRLLGVYIEVASFQLNRKFDWSALAWFLSLLAPGSVLAMFFLYDLDHGGEFRDNLDCKTLFSPMVLLFTYALCGFLIIYSFVVLVFTICTFGKVKKNKKPIESYRNEKQVWLKGFAFLIGSSVVVITLVLFINLDLPLFEFQVSYIIFAIIEVIYLIVSEVWMNHDLRSFYYKRFRSKPPVESVVYEPPKYIP